MIEALYSAASLYSAAVPLKNFQWVCDSLFMVVFLKHADSLAKAGASCPLQGSLLFSTIAKTRYTQYPVINFQFNFFTSFFLIFNPSPICTKFGLLEEFMKKSLSLIKIGTVVYEICFFKNWVWTKKR